MNITIANPGVSPTRKPVISMNDGEIGMLVSHHIHHWIGKHILCGSDGWVLLEHPAEVVNRSTILATDVVQLLPVGTQVTLHVE